MLSGSGVKAELFALEKPRRVSPMSSSFRHAFRETAGNSKSYGERLLIREFVGVLSAPVCQRAHWRGSFALY